MLNIFLARGKFLCFKASNAACSLFFVQHLLWYSSTSYFVSMWQNWFLTKAKASFKEIHSFLQEQNLTCTMSVVDFHHHRLRKVLLSEILIWWLKFKNQACLFATKKNDIQKYVQFTEWTYRNACCILLSHKLFAGLRQKGEYRLKPPENISSKDKQQLIWWGWKRHVNIRTN